MALAVMEATEKPGEVWFKGTPPGYQEAQPRRVVLGIKVMSPMSCLCSTPQCA
jgi:hypothetical protein